MRACLSQCVTVCVLNPSCQNTSYWIMACTARDSKYPFLLLYYGCWAGWHCFAAASSSKTDV